jgi:CheY-like chemotaxis protein
MPPAVLAHELRNPLAPIRNALQVIRLGSHDAALIEQMRAMARADPGAQAGGDARRQRHPHSAGPGKGSEFVVRLPALTAEQKGELLRKPPEVQQPVAPSAPRRILVVDDNVDAAESLAVLLRLEGQEVRVACDGPAALAAALADPPEMVVLDLGMPGMDGFEVARRLRALPGSGGVLLVALTGWAQEEDRRRCYEAGFDGHLPKPVEWEALRQFLAHPKLLRHPLPAS